MEPSELWFSFTPQGAIKKYSNSSTNTDMQIRGFEKRGRQAKYEKRKTVKAFKLVVPCCPSVISPQNNVLHFGTADRDMIHKKSSRAKSRLVPSVVTFSNHFKLWRAFTYDALRQCKHALFLHVSMQVEKRPYPFVSRTDMHLIDTTAA